MPAADALLCDPAEKAAREADNSARQLEYIDYLVSELHATELRESHVLELQGLAVAAIYPCAGRYRTATQVVQIQGSEHTLPEPALIRTLVLEALDTLNSKRGAWSTIRRAAHTLWRFNWIHPFAGGNGRMSRALTYLVVCIDNGAMLPGVPTMPHVIAGRRDDYIRALQAADASCADEAEPDLTVMEELLNTVLAEQLANALPNKHKR